MQVASAVCHRQESEGWLGAGFVEGAFFAKTEKRKVGFEVAACAVPLSLHSRFLNRRCAKFHSLISWPAERVAACDAVMRAADLSLFWICWCSQANRRSTCGCVALNSNLFLQAVEARSRVSTSRVCECVR